MNNMEKINFACGSLSNSPVLKDKIKRSIRSIEVDSLLNYSDPLGMGKLREKIIELQKFKAEKESVMITSSSQQALNIILAYFLGESPMQLFIQEPSYFGVHRILKDKKVNTIPFGDIEEIIGNLNQDKMNLIYLTSNFSSPSGKSLSNKEKNVILSFARQNNVVVIEDNPYNHLYYEGPRPKNIFDYSLGNVIFVGSLSKVVAPGLRVGYIVANQKFIKKFKSLKIDSDIFTSTFDQQVCYNVLKDLSYLKSLREEYSNKRDYIVELLESRFSEDITWEIPRGGVFMQINLNKKFSTKRLVEIASKNGVRLEEDTYYYNDGKSRNTFRINFVQNSFAGIKEGISRLARSIRELKNE